MAFSTTFMTRLLIASKRFVKCLATLVAWLIDHDRQTLYEMALQRGLCLCRKRTQLNYGMLCKIVCPKLKPAHRRLRLTFNIDDYTSFQMINNKLLNPPSPLRHIPLRVYVPSRPEDSSVLGSFKAVQTLIPPRTSNRKCLSTAYSYLINLTQRWNPNTWICTKHNASKPVP